MRRCHEPSFGYTYKILKGWYDNNVSTMDDVLKLDMEHKNEMNKQYARYNNHLTMKIREITLILTNLRKNLLLPRNSTLTTD